MHIILPTQQGWRHSCPSESCLTQPQSPLKKPRFIVAGEISKWVDFPETAEWLPEGFAAPQPFNHVGSFPKQIRTNETGSNWIVCFNLPYIGCCCWEHVGNVLNLFTFPPSCPRNPGMRTVGVLSDSIHRLCLATVNRAEKRPSSKHSTTKSDIKTRRLSRVELCPLSNWNMRNSLYLPTVSFAGLCVQLSPH